MDTIAISSFLANYQKKNIFKGVFACDTLPTRFTLPAAFVINLSPCDEAGSHWVALYITEFGTAYYFDSFGFKVKNSFINSFIRLHSTRVICNQKQLQHITSNKCGKFCCVFIVVVLRNIPIIRFLNKFGMNLLINDIIIENMYNYLSKTK